MGREQGPPSEGAGCEAGSPGREETSKLLTRIYSYICIYMPIYIH